MAFNNYNPNYNLSYKNGPDWIYVPDIEQVDSVQVIPGRKAWIMVQNEPVFALRSADGMGLVTTDLYRFEKLEAKPKPAFVTIDQLNDAISKLKGELKNESINTAGDAERLK